MLRLVKAVIDANIVVSALKSRQGASNTVMRTLTNGRFDAFASTALVLEYEDVLGRVDMIPGYSDDDLQAYLDWLCAIIHECYIYFRWRLFLPDAKDDMVFECALAAGARFIITHNTKDFPHVSSLGVSVVTPSDFLSILES